MAERDNGDGDNGRRCLFRCSLGKDSFPFCIAPYDETEWQNIKFSNGGGGNKQSIPWLNQNDLSYEQFFDDYLVKNIPCMFSPSLTQSWLSRQLWCRCRMGGNTSEKAVNEDSIENDLNYEYLLDVYGNAVVSAVNCNDSEYKEGYGTRDCRDMPFKDYVENYFNKKTTSEELIGYPCLYLKDWHIVRFHKQCENSEKQHGLPYQCPVYFQSDWLNEFCDDMSLDDYKFCYMGPKGSFTAFHADVYGSYSWSANIFGVKKWHLYPPGKEMRFYDCRLRKLSYKWDDPGICGEDYFEVIQKAGECIFVPSGWHHVVWNLTNAVSINHNWFNGSNLCYIWSVLQNALKEVEKELEEFRDIPEYHDQCQLILKANHGLDYNGFFDILTHIKSKRIKARECFEDNNSQVISQDERASWHETFDKTAIAHVIQEHCLKDCVVQKYFCERIQTFIGGQGRKK